MSRSKSAPLDTPAKAVARHGAAWRWRNICTGSSEHLGAMAAAAIHSSAMCCILPTSSALSPSLPGHSASSGKVGRRQLAPSRFSLPVPAEYGNVPSYGPESALYFVASSRQ